MDAPTINPNYPSQPIMCTMNGGLNLSGGSSNMAHVDYIHGCQTSAATELITASLDIKNPNEFPTRDVWREYALRKAKHFEEVNKYEKVRKFLESLMMFMNIRSLNEFPRDDYMVYDYLTNIVTQVIRHRNNNNNFHKTYRRSHVPPKSSQSMCPSLRRPAQPRIRNSTSVNNGSHQKRPVNPMRVSSSNTSPLSSASLVETQKLKTPIQETPNSKDPLLHLVDVVQSMSSKSMVSALNDISCAQKAMDSIPECPPLDSTSLLQYENEPQRKIRRTLNVSAYHDQILSDEWDIDFLETTMDMKPISGNKGFLLDEIKATNFELLETSLVVVLDTTDDYVRILGGQRGTIVKCLYTNVCFPDFCGPQKMPDFVLELHVPMDYPNSSPKIFNSGRNILSQPWKKLYEDILTRFDLLLREIHGKISLADLARKWDTSARSFCLVKRVKRLSLEQVADLERHVTYDEVKDCSTNKSSGPDVVAAVTRLVVFATFPRGCNSSFIALIPKILDAELVKDFSLISLIGNLYKIIAMILANRLSYVKFFQIS
nr:RNA-directed DNA polymerase, eukaryota, reverse transcriptase zinc-binding domain protein [Tanacetum cinerariifolium]